jgi:hypothetical protein
MIDCFSPYDMNRTIELGPNLGEADPGGLGASPQKNTPKFVELLIRKNEMAGVIKKTSLITP